jgi:Ca2+-binding EF-hand superfamily protein
MRSARAAGCGLGLGLALLATVVAVARAQNAGPLNLQELFLQLDANGDRILDRGEVPESGRTAFETLLKHGDANKDGKIDQEEYRELLSSLRDGFGSLKTRFADLDKDGDGKLSKAEYEGPEFLFPRIDADGDGFISKAEADKFQPGPGAGGALAAGEFGQRLRAMDKDGDGKVSKAEFLGPPPLFDRLDRNSDGFLTSDELGQMRPDAAKAKAKVKAKRAVRPKSA